MATNLTRHTHNSDVPSRTSGVQVMLPILAGVICAGLLCPMPISAAPTEAFVRSLITSKRPEQEKRDAIRSEFVGRSAILIDVIERIREDDPLAFDMTRICQGGLVDLIEKTDYALLLSRISTAPNIRTRATLAGVLPRSGTMIEAVEHSSRPVIELITAETESLSAIEAYAHVLSRAKVRPAVSAIRSKLQLNHINAITTMALESSLLRLGDQETQDKYKALIKSAKYQDQSHAVAVFAQSQAPIVMKYLIPWLDFKVHPKVGTKVLPPYRYCDVAVRFAIFFRDNESGPMRLSFVRRYSDVEIEEVRAWWKTVKNTNEYR